MRNTVPTYDHDPPRKRQDAHDLPLFSNIPEITKATDTRDDAFEAKQPTATTTRRRVFETLRDCGPMTNNEIARRLGWPINSITPRVFELRSAGDVIDAGKRACTITGIIAHTWRTSTDVPSSC